MPCPELLQSITLGGFFVPAAVGFCRQHRDVGVSLEVVGGPFVELLLPVLQGVDRRNDQNLLKG